MSSKEIIRMKTENYFNIRDKMREDKGLPRYYGINNNELGDKIRQTMYKAQKKEENMIDNPKKPNKDNETDILDEWDWC